MFNLTVCFVAALAASVIAEAIDAGWLSVSCLFLAVGTLVVQAGVVSVRIQGRRQIDSKSGEPWPAREK